MSNHSETRIREMLSLEPDLNISGHILNTHLFSPEGLPVIAEVKQIAVEVGLGLGVSGEMFVKFTVTQDTMENEQMLLMIVGSRRDKLVMKQWPWLVEVTWVVATSALELTKKLL